MAKKQIRVPNYSGGTDKEGGIMFTWAILRSVAWCSLTDFELKMFIYLYGRLTFSRIKVNGKRQYQATNNGQIEVAHKTLMKDLKTTSKATIVNSQNKLIKVGLVKLTREGSHKVSNMYKILYGGDRHQICKKSEERWREYPDKDWESEINRKPNNLVGNKTRFKKGVCGNPKYQKHPNKVDYHKSNGVDYSNVDSLKEWTKKGVIEDIS